MPQFVLAIGDEQLWTFAGPELTRHLKVILKNLPDAQLMESRIQITAHRRKVKELCDMPSCGNLGQEARIDDQDSLLSSKLDKHLFPTQVLQFTYSSAKSDYDEEDCPEGKEFSVDLTMCIFRLKRGFLEHHQDKFQIPGWNNMARNTVNSHKSGKPVLHQRMTAKLNLVHRLMRA